MRIGGFCGSYQSRASRSPTPRSSCGWSAATSIRRSTWVSAGDSPTRPSSSTGSSCTRRAATSASGWVSGQGWVASSASCSPEGRSSARARRCLAPRGAHSVKPVEAYERIEALMGEVSRVELFARNRRQGWDAWGDQLDQTVPAPHAPRHADGGDVAQRELF